MRDGESDSFDNIGDFLSEQYPKFAIMGVFGTVTLVLSNQDSVEPAPLEIRVGLVASLLIFSITAFWISWKSLTKIQSIGGIPKANEIAYILISLSATILGISVISISTKFSTAIQLIFELAVLSVAIIAYLRIYAQGEVLQLKGVAKGNSGRTFSFQASFFVSIYLSLSYFIRPLYESVFELISIGNLLILHISIVVIAFHLVFTHGFYGLFELAIRIRELGGRSDLIERVWSIWDLRYSVGLGLLMMFFLVAWTSFIAESSIGPNIGYYRILGMESRLFSLVNVGWYSLFSIILIILKHHLTPNWTVMDSLEVFRHGLIERVGQLLFIITLILVVYQSIVLVPNGSHVIPI